MEVVELRQGDSRPNKIMLIQGENHGDSKVKMAYNEEDTGPRRKVPPPRWADPAPVKAAPHSPKERSGGAAGEVRNTGKRTKKEH